MATLQVIVFHGTLHNTISFDVAQLATAQAVYQLLAIREDNTDVRLVLCTDQLEHELLIEKSEFARAMRQQQRQPPTMPIIRHPGGLA